MFATIAHRVRQWTKPATLGQRGERAAARYLRKQKYVIVARSARDKAGELDIVAVDGRAEGGRTVVFVEVKTRSGDSAGQPIEAVDDDKQQRLTRLALRYLKRHDLLEYRWRFDIVGVTWPPGQRWPSIEHVENAFEPADVGQMFS